MKLLIRRILCCLIIYPIFGTVFLIAAAPCALVFFILKDDVALKEIPELFKELWPE